LISNIECDLLRLRALLPSVKIVWSEILQRRYWHHANDSKGVENARKRVNRVIRNIVSSFGGTQYVILLFAPAKTVCLDMMALTFRISVVILTLPVKHRPSTH